jgi:hypothetical protein
LPAMMSAFMRSISAAVRLRTVRRPISGLTCVSMRLLSIAKVEFLMRSLAPARYKSHKSATEIAPRTARRSADGSSPSATVLRASAANLRA